MKEIYDGAGEKVTISYARSKKEFERCLTCECGKNTLKIFDEFYDNWIDGISENEIVLNKEMNELINKLSYSLLGVENDSLNIERIDIENVYNFKDIRNVDLIFSLTCDDLEKNRKLLLSRSGYNIPVCYTSLFPIMSALKLILKIYRGEPVIKKYLESGISESFFKRLLLIMGIMYKLNRNELEPKFKEKLEYFDFKKIDKILTGMNVSGEKLEKFDFKSFFESNRRKVLAKKGNTTVEKKLSKDDLYSEIGFIFENIYDEYINSYKSVEDLKGRENMFSHRKCINNIYASLTRSVEEEISKFRAKASKLGMVERKIFNDYLREAPKHFGNSLKLIMEQQEVSEHDIFSMTKIGCSKVQSLMICKNPDSEIKLLCRALQVSEDVLFKGYGKRYGPYKFKWLLDEQGIKEILSDKESLFDKEVKSNKLNKNSVKKIVREELSDIISSDEEYRKMMASVPEFSEEEEIFLYDSPEEEFENLLNPQEAMVLLEALERNDSIA